jgi:mannitol-1-phosphate 5-dehydrogenase
MKQVATKMVGKLVLFGAGKVGRSFIGQIFSRSGYEVVFIDVDDVVVNALNEKRRYRVEVKDVQPETIWVENVRAVHGKDVEHVVLEIATADVAATAVGVNNLPYIYATIAKGLVRRREMKHGPLDIIIFENLRNSSAIFRPGLRNNLPEEYPMESLVGLVETSTDKMVPDVPMEMRQRNPLLIFAEAFDIVYLDKKAFKGKIPAVEGLIATENLRAYFDRKFFTLNMGHAITAYLGYLAGLSTISKAISDGRIKNIVEGAMWESGQALIEEYPQEFNEVGHKEYIASLIRRFGNPVLRDTVYRVGRDLPRKLSRNDRLIGALLMDAKHGIEAPNIALGVAAAMLFRGKDENGELFEEDRRFAVELYPRGIDYVLREVCGLNPDSAQEKRVMDNIRMTYKSLLKNPRGWGSLL